jgi:hypothetical protein
MMNSSSNQLGTNAVRMAVIAYLPITKLRDVSPDYVVWLAATGLILLGLAWAFFRRERIKFGPGQYVWMITLIYLIFVCIVALLAQSTETSSILGSLLIVITGLLSGLVLQSRGVQREQVVLITIEALSALLIFSTVLFFLDVRPAGTWSHNTSYSSTLMAFGIYVDRAAMPLTSGGTAHSMISAVVFTGYFLSGRRTPFALTAMGCAIWGIMVGDARASLLACAFGIGLLVLLKGRGFRYVALLFPASYLVVTIGLEALSRSNVVALLARSGASVEIATGNSRTLVWDRAIGYLTEHPFALAFGNGLYSQSRIGLLRNNRFIAGFEGSGDNLSLHNISIQYLMDGGFLGLLTVSFVIFLVCKRLEFLRTSRMMRAAAGMMACMLIGGFFDVWMTPYNDEGMLTFALLAMAALVRWPGSDRLHPTLTDQPKSRVRFVRIPNLVRGRSRQNSIASRQSN